MNGVESIAAERKRQIEEEGWSAEHDDKHDEGVLASAGVAYAINAQFLLLDKHPMFTVPLQWPFSRKRWKPSNDPRRDLVKAGALIAAAIDRIDRESERTE